MSSDWQPSFSSFVTVSIFDVDAESSAFLDAPQVLSDGENVRAARFRGDHLRRRYRRAHAGLRLLLGHETGLPPAALPICTARSGKPFLQGSNLSFNLSHSGHLAAVVIGCGHEVGIDVEVEGRRITNILGVAASVLHAEEVSRLAALSPQGREPAFLRLWTAREAWLKALGTGIAAGPRHFNAAPLLDGLQAITCDDWTVRQIPTSPGVYAAVAASGSGWSYRLAAPDF